jgi:hypothetical protein
LKTTYVVAAGLLALCASHASASGYEVSVYVRQDDYTVPALLRAEQTARRILADAEVTLIFRSGSAARAKAGETAIEIQLVGRVPDNFHPGAFAFALPYGKSGARIRIFCDRILQGAPDAGTGAVLGHVLAHEIAHVLQGVSRHSEAGVLKAHWESADYQKMRSGGLRLEPRDVELIREALAAAAFRPSAAQ